MLQLPSMLVGLGGGAGSEAWYGAGIERALWRGTGGFWDGVADKRGHGMDRLGYRVRNVRDERLYTRRRDAMKVESSHHYTNASLTRLKRRHSFCQSN